MQTMCKWLVPLLSLAWMFLSCANDDDSSITTEERNLVIHLPQMQSDAEANEAVATTRTEIACTPNPYFSWCGNEAFGVYGTAKAPKVYQLNGKITDREATKANLKAKMQADVMYYVFTPFSSSLATSNKQAVPISYEGQCVDRFLGLYDPIQYLADYDFLFAEAKVGTDASEATHFHFTRVGVLVRVQLELPEMGATYKRIVLTAKEEPQTKNRFVVSGNLDLTKKKTGLAANIYATELTDVVTSSQLAINLNNIKPTEETGLTMFPAFMMYPGDMRYGFHLKLEYEKDGEQKEKLYHLNGYVYKANHYYQQVALNPV